MPKKPTDRFSSSPTIFDASMGSDDSKPADHTYVQQTDNLNAQPLHSSRVSSGLLSLFQSQSSEPSNIPPHAAENRGIASSPTEPKIAGSDVATTDARSTELLPSHRYLIGKEIGRGGMGTVYEGWDAQLQRRVAIKTIRANDPKRSSNLLRFFREARIASRLQHPGIVSVHEFDVTTDGQAFIVMGLLEGQTLKQTLESITDRTSALPTLLSTFLQVSQAIAYAHSQGIIHRDLKPSNIMIGRYGVVTVLDWGLAKVLGEKEELFDLDSFHTQIASERKLQATFGKDAPDTKLGTIFGTPNYSAPEQARGETESIDTRADVFALGSILCEILTGSPPYTGESLREIHSRAAAAEVSIAMEMLDSCTGPRSIVSLAKACLAPELSERPIDASFLVNGVTEFLESGQRRAEQELVRFFDLSLDLFCIANLSGYFCRLNNNFHKILGYSTEELTSCRFIEFVHPADQLRTLNEIEKLSRGEPAIQFLNRYRHASGHYLWLEWTAHSVPQEAAVYAVARDVTSRMQAEQSHEEREHERQRLAQIVSSADDAIVSKDLNGSVLSWNAGAEKIFGYTAQEMIGRSIAVLIPPERLHEEEEILAALKRGERIRHYETVRTHKNGSSLDISVSISPIHNAQGEVIGASKIARNITEHKILRTELEQSRRELEDFAENANVPLHWVSEDGTIIWANKAELDFLGYTREEYVGKPITDFHADKFVIDDILFRLGCRQSLSGYEARLIHKDGSIKRVSIHSSVYTEGGRFKHTRCITIDVGSNKSFAPPVTGSQKENLFPSTPLAPLKRL